MGKLRVLYKVLLSRGRKGCFVWCADAAVRDYLRDRLRLAARTMAPRSSKSEVEHRAISDPELGGSYTVKKYRSLKVQEADANDGDAWTHAAIQLVPLNPEFQTIWINPDQVEDLRVAAEFIRVLP